MKKWSEAFTGQVVYINDSIEFEDEYGSMRKTKPKQRAIIDEITNDGVTIIIDGGKYDGYDFYFYHDTDIKPVADWAQPEELLTEAECKLIDKGMSLSKAIETMEYNKDLLGRMSEQGNTWKRNVNTIACEIAIDIMKQYEQE